MKDYLKQMTTKNIITSCILLILGFFFFIKPDTTIKTICTIIGLVLLLIGLVPLLGKITKKEKEFGFDIALSVIWLIGAVLFLFFPNMIASIIPLLLGILFIFSSAFKLQKIYNVKQVTNKVNVVALIMTLLILILGIVLMFNPFKGALTITKFIGLGLIVYSILDIIENFIMKKDIKKL